MNICVYCSNEITHKHTGSVQPQSVNKPRDSTLPKTINKPGDMGIYKIDHPHILNLETYDDLKSYQCSSHNGHTQPKNVKCKYSYTCPQIDCNYILCLDCAKSIYKDIGKSDVIIDNDNHRHYSRFWLDDLKTFKDIDSILFKDNTCNFTSPVNRIKLKDFKILNNYNYSCNKCNHYYNYNWDSYTYSFSTNKDGQTCFLEDPINICPFCAKDIYNNVSVAFKKYHNRQSPKRQMSKRKSPKRTMSKRKSPKRTMSKRKSPKRTMSKRKSPKRTMSKRKSPKRKSSIKKSPRRKQ